MPTENRVNEQRAWTKPDNLHQRPHPVLHQPATFAEAEARRKEIVAELRRLQAITSDQQQPRDARQHASAEIARLAEERAALIPILERLREEEKQQRQQARRAAQATLAGAEPIDFADAHSIALSVVALLGRLAAEGRVEYSDAEQGPLATARQALVALAEKQAVPGPDAAVDATQVADQPDTEVETASVEAAQERLGAIKQELAQWRPKTEPGQGTFYTRQEAKARVDALHAERARLRAWLREHEPAWRAERQRQLLDGATQAITLNDGQPVSLERPASVLHAAHLLLRHLPTAGRVVYTPPEQFIVDALRQVLRAHDGDTDGAGLTATLVDAAGRYPHPATLQEAHTHLDLVRDRIRAIKQAHRNLERAPGHIRLRYSALQAEQEAIRGWIDELHALLPLTRARQAARRGMREAEIVCGSSAGLLLREAYALLRRMGNVYAVQWLREDWAIVVAFGELLSAAAGQLATYSPPPERESWDG